MVILYCLLMKYTLILMYNFLLLRLDGFRNPLIKYASIRTLVVIAHSCDHWQSWNIFSVISGTEKSQVTSSDAELNVDDDFLRGEKRFFERSPHEVFHFYIKICVCSMNKFLIQQRLFLQISDFVTSKIKNKGKKTSCPKLKKNGPKLAY